MVPVGDESVRGEPDRITDETITINPILMMVFALTVTGTSRPRRNGDRTRGSRKAKDIGSGTG
jgi:hypothetical protein